LSTLNLCLAEIILMLTFLSASHQKPWDPLARAPIENFGAHKRWGIEPILACKWLKIAAMTLKVIILAGFHK
jgi:hypothetical protein